MAKNKKKTINHIGVGVKTTQSLPESKTASVLHDTVKSEKKLEVLLKEYERLSNEMSSHFQIQSQIKNVSLLLIVAIATGASIFQHGNFFQGLDPNIPLILFLIASLLFTSLEWAYLLQVFEFVVIALYVDKVIRPNVCALLEIHDEDTVFFSWDRFHQLHSYALHKSGKFFIATLIFSLFGIMVIPAFFTYGVAIYLWWYQMKSHFSLPTNISSWTVLILLIFDIVYLLASFVCARYILKQQSKIAYTNKDLLHSL